MASISAFQSGLAGVQTGLQQLNKNAADIAQSTQPNSDVNVTETLVSNLSAEQQVLASLKVIETSNDTVGTLLDIKA